MLGVLCASCGMLVPFVSLLSFISLSPPSWFTILVFHFFNFFTISFLVIKGLFRRCASVGLLVCDSVGLWSVPLAGLLLVLLRCFVVGRRGLFLVVGCGFCRCGVRGAFTPAFACASALALALAFAFAFVFALAFSLAFGFGLGFSLGLGLGLCLGLGLGLGLGLVLGYSGSVTILSFALILVLILVVVLVVVLVSLVC